MSRQDAEEQAELLEVTRRFPKLEAGYRRLMELALRPRHHQPDLEADVLRHVAELAGQPLRPVDDRTVSRGDRGEDEAEQIVKRLMAEQPDDPEAVILQRGARDKKQGAAIKLLEEVVGKTTTPPAGLVGALLELYRSDKRESDATAWRRSCIGRTRIRRSGPPYTPGTWSCTIRRPRRRRCCGRREEPEVPGHGHGDWRSSWRAMIARRDGAALLRKFMDDNGTTAERLYLLSGLKAEEEDKCPRTLRQVLAIMPDHTGANNDLGYFMADRGMNLDEAETLVSKALVQPNNGSFLDSLGWVYYKQGRFSQAMRPTEAPRGDGRRGAGGTPAPGGRVVPVRPEGRGGRTMASGRGAAGIG